MAVHAHPDDESSKGAAAMARYVDEGVRVMVVTLTGGENFGGYLYETLFCCFCRDFSLSWQRSGGIGQTAQIG